LSASAKVVIAWTPEIGMFGEQKKSIRNGENLAASDLNISALLNDVVPDLVQIWFRLAP